MTLIEALQASKLATETGQGETQYTCDELGGWIAWMPDFVYKLPAEAILSTGWEPAAEMVERLTEGRWQLAKSEDKP